MFISDIKCSSNALPSICRSLASMIIKQASNMSLTGPEYMWIMSSVVLCKSLHLSHLMIHRDPDSIFLATYSSGNERKMNPYDNPNRRRMDFFTGTLGQFSLSIRLITMSVSLSFFFLSSFVQWCDSRYSSIFFDLSISIAFVHPCRCGLGSLWSIYWSDSPSSLFSDYSFGYNQRVEYESHYSSTLFISWSTCL